MLCARQGHGDEVRIEFGKAANLSAGGLSGGGLRIGGGLYGVGLEAGGGLQEKAPSAGATIELCVRQGHLHEVLSWIGRAANLSGGGLSGGGLELGGGLQKKALSAEASKYLEMCNSRKQHQAVCEARPCIIYVRLVWQCSMPVRWGAV